MKAVVYYNLITMKNKKHNNTIIDLVLGAFSSRRLPYLIIVLFVLQALWIAFSFQYPMIYDEGTHVGFIQQYTHTFFPYTTNTPATMTTQVSLFHYMLSFIYRLLDAFKLNIDSIIIILRLVNITMVAVGIAVYSKLLRLAGVKRSYINTGMIIFVLLPITPFVAATVNYDNLVFLLTAIFLLLFVKLIIRRKPSLINLILLLSVGITITMVKYSFLPMLAIASLLFTFFYIRKHGVGKSLVFSREDLWENKYKTLIIMTYFVLVTLLAAWVFVGNIVRYHALQPNCFDTRSYSLCMNNSIVSRNAQALRTVNDRSILLLDQFTYGVWVNEMIKNTAWTGNTTQSGAIAKAKPLPVMENLLFFGSILGIVAALIMLRTLRMDESWKLLCTFAFMWVAVIYLVNVQVYYKFHAAYAIQPRYILPILPIILALVVQAVDVIIDKFRIVKVGLLILILLLFTQGGGVITHIVRSEPSWYWKNAPLVDFNQTIQKSLKPLVLE